MTEQLGYRLPQYVETVSCAQSAVLPAESGYDASLTVLGARYADVGPGNDEKTPHFEPNAVALGKLFWSRYDD